jgi:hypothetical protein
MGGRSGSKAGARHIAPLVRGSFMQAIEQLKKAGTITGMADIWQEIIADDPARALELLSKYVPREMLVEIDDARPFAFLDRALTAAEWQQAHAGQQRVIEHDSGDGTH